MVKVTRVEVQWFQVDLPVIPDPVIVQQRYKQTTVRLLQVGLHQPNLTIGLGKNTITVPGELLLVQKIQKHRHKVQIKTETQIAGVIGVTVAMTMEVTQILHINVVILHHTLLREAVEPHQVAAEVLDRAVVHLQVAEEEREIKLI